MSCPGLDDVRADMAPAMPQFTLDTAKWGKVTSAKLALKVFLCEKDTGTCSVLSKAFTVQLKSDESLPSKIKIDI